MPRVTDRGMREWVEGCGLFSEQAVRFVRMAAEGMRVKEIAEASQTSPSKVSYHLRAVESKAWHLLDIMRSQGVRCAQASDAIGHRYIPIYVLGLGWEVMEALRRHSIYCIEQLEEKSDAELRKIPLIGSTTIEHIRNAIWAYKVGRLPEPRLPPGGPSDFADWSPDSSSIAAAMSGPSLDAINKARAAVGAPPITSQRRVNR